MAASLSTTLLPNSLQYKRITKWSSILNPSSLSSNKTLNLSHALEYPNNLLKLSPSRHNVTLASAASSSTEVRPSEETGSSLDSVEVFDLEGNGIPLSDLWKDRKAVVVFAHHFGCVLCRKRADYLASKKHVMDASGVALVLIGPGNIDQAGLKIIQLYMEGYRQDWKLSFEKDTVTRGGWKQGGIIVAGPDKSNISFTRTKRQGMIQTLKIF